MRQVPSSTPIETAGDIGVNLSSFTRHLRAENLGPRTAHTYAEGTTQLARFLAEQGMPQDVASIHREHVEAFITHLLERWRPATAANRFRSLQQFFKWLVEEGAIKESPMEKMRPPRVPEEAPGGPRSPPFVSTPKTMRTMAWTWIRVSYASSLARAGGSGTRTGG